MPLPSPLHAPGQEGGELTVNLITEWVCHQVDNSSVSSLTAEQAGTFLLQQGVHIDHFLCDDLVAELGSFGSPPWHICPQLLL